MQTTAFSDLVGATAAHADVGYLNVHGEKFARIPGLRIDEEAMLAVTVTPQVSVAWHDQTEDWLIPFNETDSQDGPVSTRLLLGNGPLAFDFTQCTSTLERVKEHLLVAYVFPDCVGVVRYRWNDRLLDSLNQLHQATTFYESLTEDRPHAVTSASGKGASMSAIYGRIHVDGTVEMWL
ncbi:hypothetical protein [Paraburkholderia hospita]|uniref:hypothetical protein n=1 Tax=Paraburkholderia hospita TaxID=169430 RepID=UPI000587D14F|nr:hypothetical protein [Paraburkholderia hospita]OUL70256.1 hypothetical protein CA602_48305 [Paraburkholderia hospita]